jgi:TetR/AcrR family transcriptional regulator
MSSDMSANISETGAGKRRQQQRAAETRDALLEVATEAFASHTYDGVSIRALESDAGVQRGAAAYHFADKEGLWKAAVDRILAVLQSRIEPLAPILKDLNEDGRLRAVITAFVRFSAEAPELTRLVIQEGRADSWRLDYLISTFHHNRLAWLQDFVGIMKDPHYYYMAVGAATLVFNAEHECRELFGVDPMKDDFIREHANRVADMAVYLRNQEKA